MKMKLSLIVATSVICLSAQAQLQDGTVFRLDGEVENMASQVTVGDPSSALGSCGVRADIFSRDGHAAWCSTKREWVAYTDSQGIETQKLECVLYAHWRGPNSKEDKDEGLAIVFAKQPENLRTRKVIEKGGHRTICSVALADQ